MRSKSRIRVLACLLIIFGMTLYAFPSLFPSIAPASAATRTISLTGNYPNWNTTNPTITVTKGDTITINLSSGDGASHQLLIDFDSPGDYMGGSDCTTALDKCSNTFGPSTPTQLGPFTVTSNAGTYKYYCTIHYPYMQGLFVVQNPPTPDFGVAGSPSSLSILQGSNANSTITVSSINNFAGTITLSANSSQAGPTTSLGTNPVMVSSGGTTSSRLTISIPQTVSPGLYSITVTGTNSSGSPSHTTAISVTVTKPDFSITSSPSSLTVAPNSSSTTSITVTSTNGFSGTLTLSATVSPSGPQLSLNPSSVTLTSGGSASSNLTVLTATSGLYSTPVSQGNYVVNVTASSGSISHLTTVSLTVGSTSSTPTGNSGLPMLPIIGGVIGAVVIAAVAIFLIRRRR
jgi:plastocyanin